MRQDGEKVLAGKKQKSSNSHGKDPRTFQERGHKDERWRIQERKKQGKWKKRRKKKTKCKKRTRTRWWSKIRKRFASAFTRKMKTKEEKDEKRCRSNARHPKARKCPSSPFAAGTRNVWC